METDFAVLHHGSHRIGHYPRNDELREANTLKITDELELTASDNLPEKTLYFADYEFLKRGHIYVVEYTLSLKFTPESDEILFPFNKDDLTKNEPVTSENIYVLKDEEHDVGFIAMQPLGGGLIDNIPLALGFFKQYESVVPIWGVKTQSQIEQILYFNEHPPVIDEKFNKDVEKIRNFFN